MLHVRQFAPALAVALFAAAAYAQEPDRIVDPREFGLDLPAGFAIARLDDLVCCFAVAVAGYMDGQGAVLVPFGQIGRQTEAGPARLRSFEDQSLVMTDVRGYFGDV